MKEDELASAREEDEEKEPSGEEDRILRSQKS